MLAPPHHLSKSLTRPGTPLDLRQPPLVRLLILVEQRFNLFLLLALADPICVCDLEELRRSLDQPLWLNRSHIHRILPRRIE